MFFNTESIETRNSQQPLDKTKRCFKDSANQQIKMSFNLNDYSLKELYIHLDNPVTMFKSGVSLTDQILDPCLAIKKHIKKLEDNDLTLAQRFKKQ